MVWEKEWLFVCSLGHGTVWFLASVCILSLFLLQSIDECADAHSQSSKIANLLLVVIDKLYIVTELLSNFSYLQTGGIIPLHMPIQSVDVFSCICHSVSVRCSHHHHYNSYDGNGIIYGFGSSLGAVCQNREITTFHAWTFSNLMCFLFGTETSLFNFSVVLFLISPITIPTLLVIASPLSISFCCFFCK